MADVTSIPQELIDMYKGKMNFILDRFRGGIVVDRTTGQIQWILQVMDFGGTIHREHSFSDRKTYETSAQFLIECGLECLVN
jgi:hypothetical protein